MSIHLTKEQTAVVMQVISWIKSSNKPSLTLGGYAGTGKTTLIAAITKILSKASPKLRIGYCSYTGKASRVLAQTLKNNGNATAQVSTIHSLIYSPVPDKSGKVSHWKLKTNLEKDLIIVDEASMISYTIWQDLLSFSIPIFAVGDHGQLPPISGKFNLMDKPELKLETIHRQAAENPIIQLSMQVRSTGTIAIGNYGSNVRKLSRYDSNNGQEVEELLQGDNNRLILTGYNHTRVAINQQIRQYRDIQVQAPTVSDKVICLKNNWEKDIYNGMIGIITSIKPIRDIESNKTHWYEVDINLENGENYYTGKISAHQFNARSTLVKHEGLSGPALGDLFDFGYALTVHKAQGSQSQKVLLFEERNSHMNDEDWARWLYTGITRAEEELIIVGE